jgi:hypothetical protein
MVALTLRWPDFRNSSRISIILLTTEHMKGRLGQVPNDGTHGLAVSFAPAQAGIEQAHTLPRLALMVDGDRIRAFIFSF